jgi:uncharacterized membrane protein
VVTSFDPTTLLPAWAPNVHPLIVHFPLAWLTAAVLVDVWAAMFARPRAAAAVGSFLYAVGALSAGAAFVTGRQAASTVFLSGAAHAIVASHWNWAFATLVYFALVFIVRLMAALLVRPSSRWVRVTFAAMGLAGLLLLVRTGERGARLVFEQGVGVTGATVR